MPLIGRWDTDSLQIHIWEFDHYSIAFTFAFHLHLEIAAMAAAHSNDSVRY